MEALAQLGLATVAFATTNVDDILLLAAFFADPRLRPRAVVAGQFLGIGLLTVASAVVAAASLAVPPGWVALLGIVPLMLGIVKLIQLLRPIPTGQEEDLSSVQGRSQAFAVATVTIANGGDNLGVYIPIFANNPSGVPWFAAVFAVLTAVWCVAGYALVNNRWFGERLSRIAQVILPFVLIGIGLHVLWEARVLLT